MNSNFLYCLAVIIIIGTEQGFGWKRKQVTQTEINDMSISTDKINATNYFRRWNRCPISRCNRRFCYYGCEKDQNECLTRQCCPCILGCVFNELYFSRNCWRCGKAKSDSGNSQNITTDTNFLNSSDNSFGGNGTEYEIPQNYSETGNGTMGEAYQMVSDVTELTSIQPAVEESLNGSLNTIIYSSISYNSGQTTTLTNILEKTDFNLTTATNANPELSSNTNDNKTVGMGQSQYVLASNQTAANNNYSLPPDFTDFGDEVGNVNNEAIYNKENFVPLNISTPSIVVNNSSEVPPHVQL